MKQTVMNGPIYFDEPTEYRIRVCDRPRIVYQRTDFNGQFVRFVAYRTPQEIRKEQSKYTYTCSDRKTACQVGILPTYEVQPWEFGQ